jgi:hypothetical protein
MDMNEAFHAALVDLSKSAMVRRHIEQVNSLPFASPSAMVFPTSILRQSAETLAIAVEHHRAILEAIGNRLRAYVNGDLKIEASDRTHQRGAAGPVTWRTAADFDAFKVYQP